MNIFQQCEESREIPTKFHQDLFENDEFHMKSALKKQPNPQKLKENLKKSKSG